MPYSLPRLFMLKSIVVRLCYALAMFEVSLGWNESDSDSRFSGLRWNRGTSFVIMENARRTLEMGRDLIVKRRNEYS